MNRMLIPSAGGILLTLGSAQTLLAQGWPEFPGDPLTRGLGMYLSWWKILLLWLVFLFWVWTTSWINRDTQLVGDKVGLPYTVWNPIVVFTFLGGFLLLGITVPIFLIGLAVTVLCHLVPLGTYVGMRNARVQPDERVLTPAHLKDVFSGKRRRKTEPKLPHEAGAPVDFSARGAADPQQDQANLITARQSPGYLTAKEIVADAVDLRAEKVMLDFTQQNVGVKYEIDGMWHNMDARDRETSDVMLAVLKKMCNLDVNERRRRQEGEFGALYKGTKFDGSFTSVGTQTGERALLHLKSKHAGLETLEQIGMRGKMREQLSAMLKGQGLVIICAMPGGGMSTTWQTVLRSTDRYMRDFISLEDAAKPSPYVENIELAKFNAAAGEAPEEVLRKLLLKQPDAVVAPELPNAETVRILCEQVNQQDRLVVAGVQAKEAVEALLRVLLLKAPAEEFAKAVVGVLNVRLVRRLADTCKQAYEPPPQLLQRLGLPPGRVKALYREWQPNPEEEQKKRKLPPGACQICGLEGPSCNGLGYLGRTAIFELLTVDDRLREALLKQPKLEVLRQVARQSGHRSLQEEGILLVAQGITSLNELQRVLKQ